LTPPWFANAVEGRAYVFRRRFQAINELFGDALPFDMARSCSLNLDNQVYARLEALTMCEIDALWAKVTVVVTACNRPHLLRQTMQSFVKMNTAPISECIIIEDSGLQGINDFVKDMCPFPVTCIYNPRNLGQLVSMDRAYELVRTEFLMHMEDDMEFVKPRFIEKSIPLLFTDPKVFCVWLRAGDVGVYHPAEPFDLGGYRRVVRGWQCGSETWCGFTFNSCLRLTRTARKHGPYAHIGWGEHDCNRKFADSGHYALILNDQYVKHIGWNEHCAQNWK
jgi:glycosyltransferase involved in cell wall biosynthesis